MNENAYNINDSFNEEFCLELEYHLCGTFNQSSIKELMYFWCDGVIAEPFFNKEVNRAYLSIERVLKERIIVTNAYIGMDGQGYYEMKIFLGKKALSNYKLGLSLSNCLQSTTSINWLKIDIENKKIEIRLL